MGDVRKIVLMYHDVYLSTPDESGIKENEASMYKIQYGNFEKHIKTVSEYLKKNGLPYETVQFTFDDGGSSFYGLIAPLLERYGFKGLFFIAAGYIDTPCFLTRDQIYDLYRRGHIIASHSYSHPVNIAALDYSDILNEWSSSIELLERIIGQKIEYASIPNSIFSRDVYKAAATAGIKTIYTSTPTTTIKQRYGMDVVGRFVVYGNTTSEDIIQIITNPFRRRKMMIRYVILDIAHTLLGANYDNLKNYVVKILKKQ